MMMVRSSLLLCLVCVSSLLSSALAQTFRLMWRREVTDAESGDSFGSSVAMYGEHMVVGNPTDDDNGGASAANTAGSVYIFRTGLLGLWRGQTKLTTGSDDIPGAYLGSSVAISKNLVVVGAPGTGYGDIYYSIRDTRSGEWSDLIQFDGEGPDGTSGYGTSVALYGDLLVVGAPLASDGSIVGVASGLGYVYQFNETESNFDLVATLAPEDGVVGDSFGQSVDIGPAGIVVGAPGKSTSQGAAYYYDTSLDLALTYSPDELDAGDAFGSVVAMSGNTVVVSATSDADEGFVSGAAYIFSTSDATETQKIVANDGAAGHGFGKSIDVDEDDGRIVVGAPGADDYYGAIYMFEKQRSGSWEQTQKVIDVLPNLPNDQLDPPKFGTVVAMDTCSTLAVGIPNAYTTSAQDFTGAVQLYGRGFLPGLLLQRFRSFLCRRRVN